MTYDELEAMSQEWLDEAVHEAKAAEAAEINNEGKEAQIAYLLDEGESRVDRGRLSSTPNAQNVLGAFEVLAIRQSANAPDTLEIDVQLLSPLNYIKVTLLI